MSNPIIEFAETVPGFYERPELERLYSFVHALPDRSIIIEVGVQYGRTASLYLNENRHRVYLVDCWIENEGDSWPYFQNMVTTNNWYQYTGIWQRSDSAATWTPESGVDLIHIDGGHTPEVVWRDCECYLPKLKVGGIAMFHDYKRPGADPTTGSVFPGVDKAVDHFTGNSNWEDLGTVLTQACRRKLA